MTQFQILAKRDSDRGYEPVGVQEAHNGDAAISTWYMKNPNGEITHMVAVPARSWKPKQIRTERVERIRLTDGSVVDFPKDDA